MRSWNHAPFDAQRLAQFCTYRLSAAAGDPLPSADQVGASALRCVPFKRRRMHLYGGWAGAGWQVYQPPEFALALASLTSGKPYDAFALPIAVTPSSTNTSTDVLTFGAAHGLATGAWVRVNETGGGLTAGVDYWFNAASTTTGSLHATLATALAGTSKVDLTASITATLRGVSLRLSSAWTDDTTPASAIGSQDDVPVLGSDAMQLLLGTIYTTGTASIEDSRANRYVGNLYHQQPRPLYLCPSYSDNNATGSYSVTATSLSAISGGQANFVVPWNGGFAAAATQWCFDPAVGYQAINGLGCDSTSTAVASNVAAASTRNAYPLSKRAQFARGRHYWAMLACVTGGTGTIYSDLARFGGSSDPPMTYLDGEVYS